MSSLAHLKQLYKTSSSFALALCIAISATPAQAEVSQAPLLLGGGNVPGNLALVPSVEFPTVISVANIENTYNHAANYAGYFDNNKCYTYIREAITHEFFGAISGAEGGGYFTPTRKERNCTVADEWSGNYLNWATTQTIDPFRSALTGGLRVVDTATKTILEKATRAGRTDYFPNRSISTIDTVQKVSPFSSGALDSSVTSKDDSASEAAKNYQRNKTLRIINNGTTNFYSVRVEVCKNKDLLEGNCVEYQDSWKPEGLLQRYSDAIRYSAFSYLNIDGNTRNGGVMRSQQKYIGQTMRSPGTPDATTNPYNEWDPVTGALIKNPHSDGSSNSGVINYINKFGELTNVHKSNDPASELYYAALRHFKNQGNITAYSNTTDDAQKDKFPVITNWNDPIQYACQKNVILGIGDVNTHEDRDLPHSDDTLNVTGYTQKVFSLEGINKTATNVFNGNGNSAYIAGLAYYANTTDIRTDLAGKQTASTYWVDVREDRRLRGKNDNQYWLAAKYGGFKVPKDFGPALNRTAAIQDPWWYTTSDMLSLGVDGDGGTEKRPDNFFVASDANNMVEGLKKAFANIANEVQSTTASLATNSTRLGTDTAIFQSLLDSRRWSGDLLAKKVAINGVVASTASWSAADQLDALTSSEISSRKIFTNTPPTQATTNGPFISTTGSNFNWTGLTSAQRVLLGSDTSLAQSRLNFLRGDRSNEISIDNQSNPFRQRSSRMGDIVNSDPQLIHKQDFGYARLSWNDGAVGEAYTTFRQSSAYQARKPLIVVGANDGMLHGFDASISDTPSLNGGKELFAYVPDAVISNLTALTEPNYSHRYYVDGTPRVSDVWLGATGWKTMVVGSTGAGGKSIFALDITNPGSMSSSNVMWEFRHPKMGYTIGQPALVALPNGKFAVIVSSGYHDTATTDGTIWILDAANGSVIDSFTLPTTGGLGAPLAADTDYDLAADRIYVGDTLGNLWRLDLSKHNNGSLVVENPISSSKPLFIAKDAAGNLQAITAPLSSAFNDKKEHMVYFGTGSFYRNGDNEVPATPKTDTFYGIIDGGAAIVGRGSLLQQEILKEVSLADGKTGRAVTQNTLSDTQKGWYMDLAWSVSNGGPGPKGERVVARATLRNDRVIFTTLTPAADPCAFGGSSFIMSVNRASGARLNYSYFDADGDGDIDSDDMANIDGGDIPLSGLSDPDDGVTKGVVSLYKWLCFAGSSGAAPTCIPVSGSHTDGRQSWREVRSN